MNSISIDPLLLEYAAPALLAGLVIGAVGAWLFFRRRQIDLELQVKNQESLQFSQ